MNDELKCAIAAPGTLTDLKFWSRIWEHDTIEGETEDGKPLPSGRFASISTDEPDFVDKMKVLFFN